MASSLSHSMTTTPAPSAARIESLARALAVSRGLINTYQRLIHAHPADQAELRQWARALTDDDTLGGIVQLHLRKTLAYRLHQRRFDKLTPRQREGVAEVALLAWTTIAAVFDGTAGPLPDWEARCLALPSEDVQPSQDTVPLRLVSRNEVGHESQ